MPDATATPFGFDHFDNLVLRPDLTLDVTGGVRTETGGQRQVRVRFADEWIPAADLAAATDADLAARSVGTCLLGSFPGLSRKGAVVSCACTTVHRGRWHVKTPCCQGGRYVRGTLQASVSCPSCRWMYIVSLGAGKTFWVSLGWGRTRGKSPVRKRS